MMPESSTFGLSSIWESLQQQLCLCEVHGLGWLPKQYKVTMLLPLASDSETRWKHFDTKVRNQIRKARKSGLTVQMGRKEFLSNF